jgi:uncharacterized protein (TIGR03435 family)
LQSRVSAGSGLILNQKVVDKTGIVGLRDVYITRAPDANKPAIPISINTPSVQIEPELGYPIIFKALQEQIGLKPQPDKGRRERIV